MTPANRQSTLGGVRPIDRDRLGLDVPCSDLRIPAGGGRAEVLIADRDRELVELIAYVLHKAGLRYAAAHDTTAAMELFAAVRPSVVVLDTNGLDLLQQFRVGSHRPAILF